MFVNIIQFPPIKTGKDDEFRQWFIDSNAEYAKHKGFISRRLLKSRQSGKYVGLVEHETYETFMTMHKSPTQAELRKRSLDLFDGDPTPDFLDMVLE